MPKALGKKRSVKFQEILDLITPKVTGDDKAEVISGLKQLKGVFTDTVDSLVNVSTEAEEKRVSNNQLEKDKLKLTSDNKTLTEKVEAEESDVKKENTTLKTENESLKKNAEKFDKHNKVEFIKKLTTATKHPTWDNIKEKFPNIKLDDIKDKDGNIDPEKITQEIIDESETRLTDFQDAGLFGKVSKNETPNNNTVNKDGDDENTTPKTREELTDNLNSKLTELQT